jgi:hypothetical protein
VSVHAQLAARSVVKPPQDAAASLQRKTVPAAGLQRMPDSKERRSGQPLPAQLRDYFQPRLGHDFSGVRVHADVAAASAARTQQARAYTVGRDIVFAAGEYSPATVEGRWLRGHELVHVAQQQMPGGDVPASGHEREADDIAGRLSCTGPALAPARAAAFGRQLKKGAFPKTITIGNASVTVASAAEEAEAKALIDSIKTRFGISLDSQKGLQALKANVVGDPDNPQTIGESLSNAPRTKVKDVLATSTWTVAQLRDLEQGLAFYSPVLGPARMLSPAGGGDQPLTTFSRLKVGLDKPRTATAGSVFGQYFGNQSNAALYDSAGSATELADTTMATRGVVVHEAAHAILGRNTDRFVSDLKPPYWKDENTATGDPTAEEPVTDYGKTNAREDLADAATFYFLERTTLKTKRPQRDAILDKLVRAWRVPGPKP